MGKTILVSSHILPELADICNKIGIIERGKLLFDGDVNAAIRQVRQHGRLRREGRRRAVGASRGPAERHPTSTRSSARSRRSSRKSASASRRVLEGDAEGRRDRRQLHRRRARARTALQAEDAPGGRDRPGRRVHGHHEGDHELTFLFSRDPEVLRRANCWPGQRLRKASGSRLNESIHAPLPPLPRLHPPSHLAVARPLSRLRSPTDRPPPRPAPEPGAVTLLHGTTEDDGNPYTVVGGRPVPRCPECDARLPAENAPHCDRCGWDRTAGRRVAKTYPPIRRYWESGWPLQFRADRLRRLPRRSTS